MNLRISLVDYLNSSPYDVGLAKLVAAGEVEIVKNNPAGCADQLLAKEVNLGLVPVAILPELVSPHLLPGWGIGCSGPVASVCLFSQHPIGQIERIHLDRQSRTSNLLLRLLVTEYWEKSIAFSEEIPNERQGSDKIGLLVIGDRALQMKKSYKYIYDLGEIWKNWTGLPFVFAVWAGNEVLTASIRKRLDVAFEFGVSQIGRIASAQACVFSAEEIRKYLSENIDHALTPAHQDGLNLFLEKSELLLHDQNLVTS